MRSEKPGAWNGVRPIGKGRVRSATCETDDNHRVVCIDRLVFDADGRIAPVRITFEGVEARPLSR